MKVLTSMKREIHLGVSNKDDSYLQIIDRYSWRGETSMTVCLRKKQIKKLILELQKIEKKMVDK